MHFCSESSKAESTSQQNSLKSITKEREETFKKRLLKASKSDVEKCADFASENQKIFPLKIIGHSITLQQKDFQERVFVKNRFFLRSL